MIIHKTTGVGLTEWCGERATPLPARVLHFSNPSPEDRVRDSFAQCGHNMAKMDWLFEQIREPKVVNLNASSLSLAVSLAIKSM